MVATQIWVETIIHFLQYIIHKPGLQLKLITSVMQFDALLYALLSSALTNQKIPKNWPSLLEYRAVSGTLL